MRQMKISPMGECAEHAHEKNVRNEKGRVWKQRRILGGFYRKNRRGIIVYIVYQIVCLEVI
jgi:hypothetical protein